ncbi:ABC transporter ATP-binding protein [Granulicella arctica]|uniref:Iron complex transport system ATP-binding protein n=1 Tax=Granulicella arctica TaxID=940613 RepID=A0A7Y9PHV8_9BACT|nr:ABC transporter ATP-binding protein [Granulicella arctica]NYF80054.1 iron complex transport system ATP-binding protein [Granulicella arctica]
MSSLLEIVNLGLSYGKRAVLRSITFSAQPGEFLGLVGVNGAGKSTLLDIVAGFRRSSSGSVVIAGRDQRAWNLRQMCQRVSHLPQTVHADLPYMAEQLVAMGRYPHTDRWFESDEDHMFIRKAMERTHCWEYRHRNFRSLSGGERQRVLLAACLAQNASILLLDEPSTFLDIEQQLHCFNVLREEAQTGKLCIAATHDLNLALTHCTRLIVLADGVIAHDISASKAHENNDWLPIFSSRLKIGNTPAGAPWIWYQ